jgi:hypothetical protein
MLRKSLIAFTAATVVCAGSQAVAAGFRHAMSTPRTPFPRSEEKVSPISPHAEIPIAKLDRKDLLGKKMYAHQGNFVMSRCLLNIAKRSLLRLMLSCVGLASKHAAG